jgi:hypothetical protein
VSEGIKKAVWIEKLLTDLDKRDENNKLYILTLFCDNLSTIAFIQDTKFYNKAKHIEIWNIFIGIYMVRRDRLQVTYIPSTDQLVDIFMKQLRA